MGAWRPTFSRGQKVLLITSAPSGRRVITEVTVGEVLPLRSVETGVYSPHGFSYWVYSGMGGGMLVEEKDLRPANALDRLLLEMDGSP